ncbi:MAG: hypothetical protein EX271_05235, partial [Acidimicrobiales bacterium]
MAASLLSRRTLFHLKLATMLKSWILGGISMDRFSVLIWRDLRLAIRSKTIWLQSVLFFVIFIALSGIAMGGDNDSLGRFAPALIWLPVIFAILLSF